VTVNSKDHFKNYAAIMLCSKLAKSFYFGIFSLRNNRCDGYHTGSALVMHMWKRFSACS